ncbi:unnamed protein product [Parascedosporium putredinis]|uniref:Uncharacterized protein n=1 Tax=Parascedosporium putredinis TaxID=1442378 RepID=A0A9P1HAD6_9PEZI|nr:unnamed protein product [Parascedosporium putredinis]CAI8002006.1 unnamed protein product [Parascedosporium putredinis]
MPALNQVLAEAVHIVARVVEHLSYTIRGFNGDNGNGGGSGGGGGGTSPLLFFVALGFGVVFTNLWIIVGVKYCFRYNARNRQMRLNEDGEPVALENMPRPHRRRREKKLMTMDEVNEKFPMMKYKSWVASRVREGLPATGGVTAPSSRANSVRSVEGVIQSKERESVDDQVAHTASNVKDTNDTNETTELSQQEPAKDSPEKDESSLHRSPPQLDSLLSRGRARPRMRSLSREPLVTTTMTTMSISTRPFPRVLWNQRRYMCHLY